MDQITVTGEAYKRTPESIGDNIPEEKEQEILDSTLVDTEIGVFQLNALGNVKGKFTSASLLELDWNEFKCVGKESFELKRLDRDLYYQKNVGTATLVTSGDLLNIDIDIVEDVLNADYNHNEIVIRVEEQIKSNVIGSQRENFKHLTQEFEGSYDIRQIPENYQGSNLHYLVSREDRTTLQRTTILTRDTLEELINQNGVKVLKPVDSV